MNARPKILLVDDRPENLIALEVVLKDMNVELVKTTSGNDALKQTLHHNFALALLDIQMPEMDGYELASILREEEKTAHLPFIFISAVYTDNLNVFKGYEKGAFSFITKPFQPEILINKVKFFIEKHQQEIALYNLNKDLENKNTELQSINKELESFSYSVSHDLRAPLRALNGYSKIIEEDYAPQLDDEAKRMLNGIAYNAQKMSSLIDDLLEFSRLGRKEVKKSLVTTTEMVKAVITEIKNSINHKAEITIDTLPDINADYSLLYQVWVNFISNAIKYSSKKENPQINISAVTSHNEINFCIKDNGAGFDMKYYDKLFGVFQRLHHPNDFEGTGIGLAIIQRIIAKHGGKVWAEGKPGEGASFYFSLPVINVNHN